MKHTHTHWKSSPVKPWRSSHFRHVFKEGTPIKESKKTPVSLPPPRPPLWSQHTHRHTPPAGQVTDWLAAVAFVSSSAVACLISSHRGKVTKALLRMQIFFFWFCFVFWICYPSRLFCRPALVSEAHRAPCGVSTALINWFKEFQIAQHRQNSGLSETNKFWRVKIVSGKLLVINPFLSLWLCPSNFSTLHVEYGVDVSTSYSIGNITK